MKLLSSLVVLSIAGAALVPVIALRYSYDTASAAGSAIGFLAAEWASRRSSSAAPAIAAYFAYETFAGAFLHLVILGVVMGVLLGGVGGPLGKSLAGRLSPQNSEVGSRSGATMAAGGSHVQRRHADPERP